MKIAKITLYAAFPDYAADGNPQAAAEDFADRLLNDWYADLVNTEVEFTKVAEPDIEDEPDDSAARKAWRRVARQAIDDMKPGQVGLVEVNREPKA